MTRSNSNPSLQQEDHSSVFYPPGGLLIWILIVIELFTFGLGLLYFVYEKNQSPEMFLKSAGELNLLIGSVNTVLLLMSGYFVASSIREFKMGHISGARGKLLTGMLGGATFVLLKATEFYDKIEQGFTLSYNLFFDFYWLLTGFHLIHVIVGVVILMVFYFSLRKNPESIDIIDFEAGAAFWHMCDLIWLMIFPALYLII